MAKEEETEKQEESVEEVQDNVTEGTEESSGENNDESGEQNQEETISEDPVEEGQEKSTEEESSETKKAPEKSGEESEDLAGWEPKTELGQKVKNGEIRSIDEILDQNKVILEEQIVDSLIDVKSDLASIGQSKGKFGGGSRRAWRQTQKKTEEGSVITFSAIAIVGDENGHLGLGKGRASETLPAREKSLRAAKKNIFRVNRTCAAFDCNCSEPHTIPYEVTGKSGSVKVKLIPAPQGTGLVVGDEAKKVLKMAGIKDVYSKTFGQTKITYNFIKAIQNALKKTNPKQLKREAKK